MATYRLKRKYFGAIGEIGNAAANIVGGTVNAAKNTAGAVLEGTGGAVKTVSGLAEPVGAIGGGALGAGLGLIGGPAGSLIGGTIGSMIGGGAGKLVKTTGKAVGEGLQTAGQGMQGY